MGLKSAVDLTIQSEITEIPRPRQEPVMKRADLPHSYTTI